MLRRSLFPVTFPLLIPIVFAFRSDRTPAPVPRPKHRFTVIAHRGMHTRFPENSIASFQAAAAAGVDYVEMDLRTTRDSVLVILHDGTLDRTTNGSGAVSNWSWAALQKLQLKNRDGALSEPVPRFDSVLAACRGRIYIYLDFKSASVSQTMTAIRRYGMEEQVIVYINNPGQYREWKTAVPAMPLMVSLPDSIHDAAAMGSFLRQYPAALLDGDFGTYNRDMLKLARDRNVPVWPDIQGEKEAENWPKAIDTGFTGLQTDHPEALIDWLKKRGLRG